MSYGAVPRFEAPPRRRGLVALPAALFVASYCAARGARGLASMARFSAAATTLAPSAAATTLAPSASPAPTAPPTSRAPTPAAAPYALVEIPMATFLASAQVRAFLASVGVTPSSPRRVLERYVPRKLVLQVWPSRVQGELGPDAMGGYVALNVAYLNDTAYTASYLIVTDLCERPSRPQEGE